MKRLLVPCLLLGLVVAVPASAQDAGHAGHDAHGAQDSHASHDLPVADPALPAQRWRPDAPLRQGMQRVRAATTALAHGGHGHLDEAQVANIADELQSAVEAMFAGCKLEPEPDAALHPLLARVLAAATTLRERGFDAGAQATLEQVLADYPRLFDDPAWSESQSD